MTNPKYSKKTKIVATLGPATANREVLSQMIINGVDVFRVNFSHADYSDVKEKIELIRELDLELGYHTAILADLQGPKLRIGIVEEGAVLQMGDILTFTNEKIEGTAQKVFMTYQRFPKDVKVGERILIDDGKLILEVVETNHIDTVKALVIQGGPLKSKKGVNLPNTHISLPALTEKDIEDAKFAIQNDFDWIALSFVRTANDIVDLKKLITEHGTTKIPIVAKIEKPEGVENIQEILEEADALMVARGDLGVEMPYAEVPLIQKRLVDIAKVMRKPAIIATQMMESMITSMSPTRAEVNDVANSVMDGADAVMLSGETSVGMYPVEVIKTMSNIIQKVENDSHISVPTHVPVKGDERYITNSVCYAAVQVAKHSQANAIVSLTYSGYTAFQISSHRPSCNIIVFTSNKGILKMLSLLWGVRAFYHKPDEESTDETVIRVNKFLHKIKIVEKDDIVINLNAVPIGGNSVINALRMTYI